MPPTNRTDPLGRQLELYGESWETDHEEVKRILWRFEDNLAVGLALFKAIHDRYWTWHDRIVRGTGEYDSEEEREVKERFVGWLRPCKWVMKRLEQMEKRYGALEGGQQFRRFYREARQILKTWTPPKPLEPGADAADELEGVPTHTDRVLTLEEMASELGRLSRPSERASVPLRHKIDDSQVF